MSQEISIEHGRRLRAAFRMPSVQTMMSRKSSITNAFVNAIIPVVEPKLAEIAEARAYWIFPWMTCGALIAAMLHRNGIIFDLSSSAGGRRVTFRKLPTSFQRVENAINPRVISRGKHGCAAARSRSSKARRQRS